MAQDTQTKVYKFVKRQTQPVTVQRIKHELDIRESNVVEKAVLKGLNEGRLEMTPLGFQVRN